jgi:hypothetical protein
MIITSYSNIDLIQGVIGYGNATEGITDWRIENTGAGVFNIHNSSSIIRPSGGTTEIGQITNSTDRYMIFKEGTSTFTVPAGGIVCDILVVGGGGGGGTAHGGGGGAGALIYTTNQTLSSGAYTINVGNGGAAVASRGITANNGQSSSILFNSSTIYLAIGGGGGGGAIVAGANGGSGGGGDGAVGGTALSTNTPLGTYGFAGGTGGNGYTYGEGWSGGGGGGAGVVGGNAVSSATTTTAGNGGIGREINIIGTATYYAGGGGGGVIGNAIGGYITNIGSGGIGGGGAGGKTSVGVSGIPNTGGGGGGGGFNRTGDIDYAGGAGGSGIVIIRYRTTNISIIDNGNIGIGTTPISSSSKLEIFGDVNINTNYRKNNINVINDTSNYVLTTSNLLVPRIIIEVGHGSNYVNRIATQINTSIDDTSNYVAITSSLLANRVSSQWTDVSSGIHYTPITSSFSITSSPIATTVGTTGDYTYMAFTYTTETAGTGTGQSLYTINVPTGGMICDVLVVGGGGSGGRSGGGGGTVIYSQNIYFPSGGYSIKVGNGAISVKSGSTVYEGIDGKSSDIDYNSTTIFRARGGGGGGKNDLVTGRTGGSSGGGEYSSAAPTSLNIISTNTSSSSFTTLTNQSPNGLTIYGNTGGIGFEIGGNYMGGGGGGAGGAGGNGNSLRSGAGGVGIYNSITGSDIIYGSGGSSGVFNQVFGSALVLPGAVTSGGGTGAYNTNASGTGVAVGATIAGRGGGGGGWTTSGSVQFYAGDGGSGIVILRFLSSTRNVGIGTTNPTSELHVYDDTTTNTKLTVQNNFVEPIVLSPNTIGYTVAETLESNKFFRTLTFNYFPNYPEDSPNTALLAWYRFNGDGLDYNPYVTKHNLINTGATYSSGTTADSFFQGRRYINLNTGGMYGTTLALANRAFSFALWLRITSTGGAFFVVQGPHGTNTSLHIGTRGNNSYSLAFYSNDLECGVGVPGNPTSYPDDINNWVHLVYVVLPNYNRRIYRNGVLIAQDANTAAFYGSGNFNMGGTIHISDFRIYNNGLSATEVATLYASYTNLVITDNYTVNFKSPTTLLVNNVSRTVNGTYALSMGHLNDSMLPASGQTDIPLASTVLTSLPIKYEYSNTALSLPALITVAGATSSFIGTTERAISFTYTSDSTGYTGQTLYTFTPTEDLWCDILIVGGGGGGGCFGGGGGGGGVLLATNLKLSAGIGITVKVGDGGTGATTPNSGINGLDGYNSSIIINSIEYIAIGGGGGGSRNNNPYGGRNGNNGGSGGGGSTGDGTRGFAGISNKNNYANFQSFGNNGGDGSFGGSPFWASGGGGGAGSIGANFSNTTGGGNGGRGKEFISYFGTNVGHYGFFAGGGGGGTYINAGNRGYGNGGLGLYGGGGNAGYDGTLEYSADNGLINTGGGGGGGKYDGTTSGSLSGGKGGSGFVIIRYRRFTTQSASLELITPLSITEPQTQTQTFNVESIYPPYRYFTYNDTNGVYTVLNGSIEASNSTSFSYTYSYNDSANTQGNNEQTSSTLKYTHGMGLYTFSVGGTQTAGGRSSGIFIYGLSSDYSTTTNGNRPGVNFDDNAALPDGAGWYVGSGWTNATTYNSSFYYNPTFQGAWIKIEMPVGIVFSSFRILRGPQNRAPKAFKIYGSNTNTTTASDWILLHTETNYTYTAGGDFGVKQSVNNVLTFKNYLMVVNEITAFDGGLLVFQGWYIYGNEQLTPVVINSDYKYLSFRHNPTAVEQKTGVGGWRLVRFLPPTATGWHPINDNLAGTTAYGKAYNNTNAWSIPFGTYDEFCFSTLGLRYWLYTTRNQAIGQAYDGASRTIIRSSISTTPYTAVWYNRTGFGEDPWIGLRNHAQAPTSNPDAGGDLILYGENSFSSGHWSLPAISVDGGICVWVRNRADTNIQTSYSVNFPENTMCDLLVVGGGGGGGYSYVGGGGGSGGYVYLENISVPAGNYTINVGCGGSDGIDGASPAGWGGNGGNSSITGAINYIALGGGGGAGGSAFQNITNGITGVGNNGGSGGGGSYRGASVSFTTGGTSTQFSTYGYGNGGSGNDYNTPGESGGGGGGASGMKNGISGIGNNGLSNSITGSSITYAGGGGAGCNGSSQFAGGSGGGGGGATGSGTIVAAVAGTDGLGGGGGGARGSGIGIAARGGSGIVIIRYRSAKIGNRGYNIGNYNGDFKIVSSTYLSNSQDNEFMRITRDGASIYNPTGSPLWSTVSDRRIKENIEKASYDKCYESINKLELYRFSYIKELNNINKDLKQLGYIAQEVKDIFPKAVSTQEFYNENLSISDMLSIDVTQINYSLYGAVKKLMEMYSDKKERLQKLKYLLNISDSYAIDTSNLLDTTSNISIDTSNLLDTTSNISIDTSNISIDTSNILIDTSNISIDTSNISIDTSNILIDTSNILIDTSNISIDTSNISIDTSNILIDTSNILIDTSNILIDTSNISIDTSNISIDTSNISIDTSNLLDTTSNISIDTSNILIDTSNISIDTSNISIDTSNISIDTSNISIDTSNISIDTSNQF